MLAFLDSFANGLEALGKLLIAQGIALEAVATMDPATKVVAGIAAVAIGAAIQAQMAKNREKGFASGGLIGGNSFSGDRLLAPVNSGEVILNTGQQNQLLRMANGSGGNGNNNIIAKFTGRDLLIMYDNARKDGRR
jgi:hypothetical protein